MREPGLNTHDERQPLGVRRPIGALAKSRVNRLGSKVAYFVGRQIQNRER